MEEKDIILTERYLDGDLTGSERQMFTERLQLEPALQKHLNWQQSLRNNRARQAKKATLLQMLEEEKNLRQPSQPARAEANVVQLSNQPKRKPFFSRMRIAATIAILVLGGAYLFKDSLFYAPDRIGAVTISTEMGENDPAMVTVIQSFNREEYAEVNAALAEKSLADLSPDLLRAKGIAEIETGQLEPAIKTFQYLQNQHSIHSTESQFYLGIIYYRMEDWIKSKKALESIPENSSFYERAQELLAELAGQEK